MEFKIEHLVDKHRFEALIEGKIAFVEYTLVDNTFDIIHTIVPKELEGRGIAGKIVKYAYEYAKSKGFQFKGSCSYANVWLQRHPNF